MLTFGSISCLLSAAVRTSHRGSPADSLGFRSKFLDFIGIFSAAIVIKVSRRCTGAVCGLRHLDFYTKLSTRTMNIFQVSLKITTWAGFFLFVLSI